MGYWLSKRRISKRVPHERGCMFDHNLCFCLLRCPACREIYLAELEWEQLYTRRGLRKAPQRLSRFWESGCLRCGHVDTSEGCRKWNMELEEVRASWWKWALPARLRRNRHKRDLLRAKLERNAIWDKSNSPACEA